VKPANVLRLYRVRLRARLAQECLAVLGIAAGVALLFASQVSSSSLQSSVGDLTHGIAGDATLQLLARSPQGFPQSTLARVRAIPGVRTAAPLLEADASASGPKGSQSVELVGADSSLAKLGGTLVRHAELTPFGGVGAIVLPAPLARAIGVTRFGQEATFQLAGRTATAPLYEQLRAHQIGALVGTPVALAPLAFAQELAGVGARVSRILVRPSPGAEAQVRAALRRIAAGRLNVEPIGYDETLFAKAAAASNQSTALFAAISALVGFLFAFNAMLLTVPQRRRLIADLRRAGYTPRTVIAVLMLDALVLGVVACVLGLALGDELSIHLFHANPAFLSLAFALGSARAVSWQSVALAVGGGMAAAIVAVMSPLRDILSRDPLAAIAGPRHKTTAPGDLPRKAGLHDSPPAKATALGRLGSALDPTRAGFERTGLLPLAGLACLAGATAILLAAPDAALPGMVLLFGALLLELPLALNATLALVKRLASRITSPVAHVATMELRAARARAMAIAATGAVAVFGSVAIQGAHGDLLAGLEGAARDMNAFTDVWVAPAGSYNLLQTAPFHPTLQGRLQRLPGVRAVGLYRSGLLDYGERRVLVIAPPRTAAPMVPADQIVQGDPQQAATRVRAGGWVVLSRALAEEHHLRIGEAFTLPSPDPRTFRIAALSTNLSWEPGAIVMSASDYARAWGSNDATAYAITLTPGISPSQGAREIERALAGGGRALARDERDGGQAGARGGGGGDGLGPNQSGMAVETAAQHAAKQSALSREALARLTQIAALIPLAAVLAMAAAMGALVWQRRPRLAKLKLEGLARAELWRTILLESLLLVGVGCLTGAVFGLYGQQLADRALADAINFPVVHSVTALTGLESVALVAPQRLRSWRSRATSPPACRRRWRCRTDARPDRDA